MAVELGQSDAGNFCVNETGGYFPSFLTRNALSLLIMRPKDCDLRFCLAQTTVCLSEDLCRIPLQRAAIEVRLLFGPLVS
jgi:hypothetical protein